MITNLSILPTTLVVWKQLWGGRDRCIIKNVNSSAGPKLSLGCGTEVSSNSLCSCIQTAGRASAAKQVGKSVTSLLSAVVSGCVFKAKFSICTDKTKQIHKSNARTDTPPRNLKHWIQSGTLVLLVFKRSFLPWSYCIEIRVGAPSCLILQCIVH